MYLPKRVKKEWYREAIQTQLVTCMPFVKLAPGKYLIGSRARSVQLKGSTCYVKTGSGLVKLTEYLKRYSRSKCIEFNNQVYNGAGSMKNTELAAFAATTPVKAPISP